MRVTKMSLKKLAAEKGKLFIENPNEYIKKYQLYKQDENGKFNIIEYEVPTLKHIYNYLTN